MNEEEKQRLIEMAWQDRTHFDTIKVQLGISENQVKKMMRKLISPKAYKRWRNVYMVVKPNMHSFVSINPRAFKGHDRMLVLLL